MTAIDLSALSPEVVLMGTTTVAGPRSALTSTAVTGFSDVASVTIVTRVERVDNSNGELLSVTVQGSDDGVSWSTVAGPYSFSREGTQTATVAAPADRLRVTYSAARGVREATIGSVTARLSVVDAPTDAAVLAIVHRSAQITPWDGSTIPFNVVDYDPDALWDSPNSQFVIAAAGWYRVSAYGSGGNGNLRFSGAGTGSFNVVAVVFGAGNNVYSDVVKTVSGLDAFAPPLVGFTHLDVADAVVLQGSVSANAVVPAGYSFAIERVASD